VIWDLGGLTKRREKKQTFTNPRPPAEKDVCSIMEGGKDDLE